MPFTPGSAGIKIAVRLTPKAAKNYFGRQAISVEGRSYLKAYVTAPPENGKANKALIKMLSKSLKLPVGNISVASGATNRNKQILIEGNSLELVQRLEQWIRDITK